MAINFVHHDCSYVPLAALSQTQSLSRAVLGLPEGTGMDFK